MKILLISGFFPPKHTAGSEKRTYGYARTLLSKGHDVQVLCADEWTAGNQYWNGYYDEVYHDIPIRRLHINWKLAPDPNQYLYRNAVIAEQLEGWLAEWQPDIVHVISCYTASASVIEIAKAQHHPVILTLVDYWFLCPRLSLLHADGSLCSGQTTSWECVQCLLWGAKAHRWLRTLVPKRLLKEVLLWVSRHPGLSRQRGLRGMALNIDDRKAYLSEMLKLVD